MLVAALASLDAATASAEVRGALRLGVMTLELESSPDTPLFGDDVTRAVNKYNTAVAAYDRATGTTTERIDAHDLGVAETLFMLSPGIELGVGHYFFRLEAPIGLSSDLRSIGAGVYPLNFQWKLRRDLAPYVSAGATASWLDRPGPGDVGGLLAVRAAAGMRIARHFLVELGYSAFALGGTVNSDRLDSMAFTPEDMQHPDKVVAAGEARGIFDVSIGFAY
jgi:hypothetical protein